MAAVVALAGCAGTVSAQELNCEVTVNSDQIEGTNKQVFETLQQAINDYMNTTTFTNAQFATNEKIECRLFLTIKEVNDDVFSGDLQVQSLRPVYNSSYTTTLINFRDTKIDFTYRENEPLVFSVNNMESQLTAILNFYAYLILAVDFDSFSPRGGDPYFDRLSLIVQVAQSSGESGPSDHSHTRYGISISPPGTRQHGCIGRQRPFGSDRVAVDDRKSVSDITHVGGSVNVQGCQTG